MRLKIINEKVICSWYPGVPYLFSYGSFYEVGTVLTKVQKSF